MSYQTLKSKTEKFLGCKVIAVIGFSINSDQPANLNYQTLKKAGYQVYPVNPNHEEVKGEKCYPDVAAIPEKVEAALIFTKSSVTSKVVKTCYEAGIKNIWIHKGIGEGSISEEATAFLQGKTDVNFINGACPMMFLKQSDWFHKSIKQLMRVMDRLPD